jgi:hypothetical protein
MSPPEERSFERLYEVVRYQPVTYIGGSNSNNPRKAIESGDFHGTKRYYVTSNAKQRVNELLQLHQMVHGKLPSKNKHSRAHVSSDSGCVFIVMKRNY